jgi:DNA-binding winged helix-turn-helix (wHTH) protein
MEVLRLLVEEKGQLVSRDRIIERVWGKDVLLDTDNSINAAVRKIRQALKDDPEQPRFVQTVTGRGYRFIASVEPVASPVAERHGVRHPCVKPACFGRPVGGSLLD